MPVTGAECGFKRDRWVGRGTTETEQASLLKFRNIRLVLPSQDRNTERQLEFSHAPQGGIDGGTIPSP